MEEKQTMQDIFSGKIPDYLEMAEVVTRDSNIRYLAVAPRGTSLDEGDIVELSDHTYETDGKATVVQTLSWVSTDSDLCRFLCNMFPDIQKVTAVWSRKELRWN